VPLCHLACSECSMVVCLFASV